MSVGGRETVIVCETESVCALTLLQSGNPCKAVRHVRLVEGAKHVVRERETVSVCWR